MKPLVYVAVIFIVALSSCLEDSPLSDVEIYDPSLIQADIQLYRMRDNGDRISSRINVFLLDKNTDVIELKGGNVYVNNHKMRVATLLLTGGPYYTIDSTVVSVEPDSRYVFTIELSDGKQYEAVIETQAVDFQELNLPDNYSKLENMQINWKGYETVNDFKIHLICDYRRAGESGQTRDWFTPNEKERAGGSYVISKSYFNQEVDIYKATVRVSSKKCGTVDPRFRSGSKICSSFIKESECNVN